MGEDLFESDSKKSLKNFESKGFVLEFSMDSSRPLDEFRRLSIFILLLVSLPLLNSSGINI